MSRTRGDAVRHIDDGIGLRLVGKLRQNGTLHSGQTDLVKRRITGGNRRRLRGVVNRLPSGELRHLQEFRGHRNDFADLPCRTNRLANFPQSGGCLGRHRVGRRDRVLVTVVLQPFLRVVGDFGIVAVVSQQPLAKYIRLFRVFERLQPSLGRGIERLLCLGGFDQVATRTGA